MLGACALGQTYLGGEPQITAPAAVAKGYAKSSDAQTGGAKASDA